LQIVEQIVKEDAIIGKKLVGVLQGYSAKASEDEKKEYKTLDEYLRFRRRDFGHE